METIHLLKVYKDAYGIKRYCCKRCMVDLSPWGNLRRTTVGYLSTCVGKGVHFGITEHHEQEVINGSPTIWIYIKHILARFF